MKACRARKRPEQRFLTLNEHIAVHAYEPRPNCCATILRMLQPLVSWRPRWKPSVRGDLYRFRAPKDVKGYEQAGKRFAVVVQSGDLPLSTWVVAPTSTGRREASFRPEIEINGARTRVMVEQLTVVDPEARLGEFVGRLNASEQQAVNAALLTVLGLD